MAEARPGRGPAGRLRPEDEALLLERVAEGDGRSFESLYRVYYPRLFSYLHRITRRAELVEEVVDDVMLAVWRQARRFENRSLVSTWIFGIAYRQALKALRRSSRHRLAEEELDADALVAEDSPEAQLSERERARRLVTAFKALSPEQRAVVELTYYHGLSYREIAEIVSCPVGTVKTRMFHARRILRRIVPELHSGGGRAQD